MDDCKKILNKIHESITQRMIEHRGMYERYGGPGMDRSSECIFARLNELKWVLAELEKNKKDDNKTCPDCKCVMTDEFCSTCSIDRYCL